MRIETILNSCQKFKSFVYKNSSWGIHDGEKCLDIHLESRKNSKAICSCCHQQAPCYDTQETRRFEFIPLLGHQCFFIYKMRRVNCKSCNVKIEEVPWTSGKQTLTKSYMQFLAGWAKKLSWQETARSFKTSWSKVFHSVQYIVEYGIKHRDVSRVESIGIDEIAVQKGHKYVTVVYQIDKESVRLLWIGKDRRIKTLLRFFRTFGPHFAVNLKHICSDMWPAYLKVIKKKAPQAIHILDRFHIVAHVNKAIDEVRALEHRQIKEAGHESVLTNSRWCLLKRKENLTQKQEIKLNELLKYNLSSVRAYLLKEDLQGLWEYVSPAWAGKFIDRWCTQVRYTPIAPMKKIAKMLQKHKPLILNWFKAKKAFSSGIVEGLNNKAKVATRKAYGFRTYKCAEIA